LTVRNHPSTLPGTINATQQKPRAFVPRTPSGAVTMTEYSGSVTISGSLRDGLGDTATLAGTFGITLSTFLSVGESGTANESVNGSLLINYAYAGGGSGTINYPFSVADITVPFTLGNFNVNESAPVTFAGATFGVSVSGSLNSTQASISEAISATASGTYLGVSFYVGLSGSGTLNAVLTAPSITGTEPAQAANDTTAVFPFGSVAITDSNAGFPTETVIVQDSSSTNGMLSDTVGGSYDPTTGLYEVTGTPAQVTAALHALSFTPKITYGTGGQTSDTGFTISVTDSDGASASNSRGSVDTTSTAIVLSGTASQYQVADDSGTVDVQDTVAGRDGTQTSPGATTLIFTNGVGLFDPTGTAEDIARLYGAALRRAPTRLGWNTGPRRSTMATFRSRLSRPPLPLRRNSSAIMDRRRIPNSCNSSTITFWAGQRIRPASRIGPDC
jgi:hypothetical protein